MFSPVYFYNPEREILDVQKLKNIGTCTVRNVGIQHIPTGKTKEKTQG
jgi:hypothetical protein